MLRFYEIHPPTLKFYPQSLGFTHQVLVCWLKAKGIRKQKQKQE